MEQYKKENPRYNDGYFDAFAARSINNHYTLIEVAEELTKRGYECFVNELEYREERIKSLRITKNQRQVLLGFATVPFRWRLGGMERYVMDWDFPYEIDEIEQNCVYGIGYSDVYSKLIGKDE